MLRHAVLCIATVAVMAGCSDVSPEPEAPIFGRWTPVGTNDCSSRGLTVTMRASGVFGMSGGNRNELIGKIVGHREVEPQTIDLIYQQAARSAGGGRALEDAPRYIRFSVIDADRIRAVSDSRDGRVFTAITPPLDKGLDLKRCD